MKTIRSIIQWAPWHYSASIQAEPQDIHGLHCELSCPRRCAMLDAICRGTEKSTVSCAYSSVNGRENKTGWNWFHNFHRNPWSWNKSRVVWSTNIIHELCGGHKVPCMFESYPRVLFAYTHSRLRESFVSLTLSFGIRCFFPKHSKRVHCRVLQFCHVH